MSKEKGSLSNELVGSLSPQRRPSALVAVHNQMYPIAQRSRGKKALTKADDTRGKTQPSAPFRAERPLSQKAFVEDTTTLPAKISPEDRASLEQFGFKFHQTISNNMLLRQVDFPPGWKKKYSVRKQDIYLVDGEGTVWARMFYNPFKEERGTHFHIVNKGGPGLPTL